jgi:hypothetical protein
MEARRVKTAGLDAKHDSPTRRGTPGTVLYARFTQGTYKFTPEPTGFTQETHGFTLESHKITTEHQGFTQETPKKKG